MRDVTNARLNSRDAFIVQAFNMKRDHDLHDLSLHLSSYSFYPRDRNAKINEHDDVERGDRSPILPVGHSNRAMHA